MNRELDRWRGIENSDNFQDHRLKVLKEKYGTGNKNKKGVAYDIVNNTYEDSPDGKSLRVTDEVRKIENLVRRKKLDSLQNSGFNILNGSKREAFDSHIKGVDRSLVTTQATTPQQGAHLLNALSGTQSAPDLHQGAGKPARMPEREFAKKKIETYGWQLNQNGKLQEGADYKTYQPSDEAPRAKAFGDPTQFNDDSVAKRINESYRD
eukprot:CAMPEP_0170486654 /NCGR_PEP_ID=MMETSP0208-20121228/5609_1 /TAXON_ID=197538 /ORGANISM="Strombidium inclinatum, Strain S3" /LENGTH=207 /DNA_ID=CAMNT_0010760657 /DNA_START=758 /DNA_END=1381 /DNA_ORIENTATION=-